MGGGYGKKGVEHKNYATGFRSHIKRLQSHKKQREKMKNQFTEIPDGNPFLTPYGH